MLRRLHGVLRHTTAARCCATAGFASGPPDHAGSPLRSHHLKGTRPLPEYRFEPRFAGVPTFLKAVHETDLSQVDVGIVGVPFDGGVTNRTSARLGPREVRHMSYNIRPTNQATGASPFTTVVRVADVGGMPRTAP